MLVISAPSGAGKSTLIRKLLTQVPGLRFSVSYTTREARAGEAKGLQYHFVSRTRFERMARAGKFIEWAEVHGQLYGTSWAEVKAARAGEKLLLDIDVQGHRNVRRRLRDVVSVFILPPSFRTLKQRLMRRHSEDPTAIARRLADARQEVGRWREYDYIVVNDDLDRAVRAVSAIVVAARFRRRSQEAQARRIAKTFGG